MTAVRMADVFSLNHLELLALCGRPPQSVLDKAEIEALAQDFLECGVGLEAGGTVVVRAAEYGSMVVSHSTAPVWISSCHSYETEAPCDPKVVDPTGAGNAFLGAYAVGFLRTGGRAEAARYGSVGASFALEQVGSSIKSIEGGKELWNGTDVDSRLNGFISHIRIVSSTT